MRDKVDMRGVLSHNSACEKPVEALGAVSENLCSKSLFIKVIGHNALVIKGVLLRTLKDYSEKMNDYILILLPADEKDRQLLESRASELESFYIIASSYEDFKKLPPIRLA